MPQRKSPMTQRHFTRLNIKKLSNHTSYPSIAPPVVATTGGHYHAPAAATTFVPRRPSVHYPLNTPFANNTRLLQKIRTIADDLHGIECLEIYITTTSQPVVVKKVGNVYQFLNGTTWTIRRNGVTAANFGAQFLQFIYSEFPQSPQYVYYGSRRILAWAG